MNKPILRRLTIQLSPEEQANLLAHIFSLEVLEKAVEISESEIVREVLTFQKTLDNE